MLDATKVRDRRWPKRSWIGAGRLRCAVLAASLIASFAVIDVAPAAAATALTIAPASGPVDGGGNVVITGSFRTTARATTVSFGGVSVAGLTCAATSCTVKAPAGNAGTVAVTVNDGAGVSAPMSYTYVPTITAISPNAGPSAGGTAVRIDGSGLSTVAGATVVRFGAIPATAVSCTSAKRCTAVAPAGLGAVGVSATVNGATSTTNPTFTYNASAPTVSSLSPASAALNTPTSVTITGTGFFTGATNVTFGLTPPVIVAAACATANSCTVVAPATATAGPVSVVVTVGALSSSASTFTFVGAAPVVTSISPSTGPSTGGNAVVVTGTNLSGATIRFGAFDAAAVSPCTATSCTVTAPAAAVGGVAVTAAVGPSVSNNTITYGFQPALQSPPVAPHSIIAFPQRDFVSVAEFTPSDGPYTIEVRSAGGALRSRATHVTPFLVAGVWTMEVNHPGGVCWETVTPDIAFGDTVSVVSAAGVVSRTTVANVTAEAPRQSGPLTVVIRGRALNLAGTSALPIGEIEHRLVNPTFVDLGGKRTLRAAATAADGTLTIDAAGNYTATYVLPDASWVDAALAAESRGLWLGTDPAAAVESTIYEVGSLVAAGPAAPCAAPLEADLIAPTTPVLDDIVMTLDSAHLAWAASSDNRAVTSYEVRRDGVVIANVPGNQTIYDDLHVTPVVHSWQVQALDAAGNRSLLSLAKTATAALTATPDLSVSVTHLGSFTVGTPASVTLGARNIGSTPTAGLTTLGLTVPAGLSVASVSSLSTGLTCDNTPTTATCTTLDALAVGDAVTATVSLLVASDAVPSAVVHGAVATTGDSSVVNDTTNDSINVDAAITTTFDPPAATHSVIAFPARDFISSSGYVPGQPYTVRILRNGLTIAESRGVLADAAGFVEINHLGPICWDTVTPHLVPGDVVLVIDKGGNADKTTIANVQTDSAENLGGGVIRVRGTAQDADGNPLPIGQIEQRVVGSSRDPFDKSGKRTMRADNTGQADGLLTYDAPGSINWTATYTGLTDHDVNLTLTDSDIRLQWNGRDPLALTELTIFEKGAVITRGPAAGCSSPADTAALPASASASVTVSHGGSGFTAAQSDAAFTMRVRNQGNAPTAPNALVQFTLPGGLTAKGAGSVASTGGAWDCSVSGPSVNCLRASSMPVGADETIVVPVNVSAAAAGTATVSAEISAGFDRDSEDNWASDVVTVAALAVSSDIGVAATHSGVLTADVLATENITVTNHATAPYAGPVVANITLPIGFTFTGFDAGGWTCPAVVTLSVTCTSAGPLAAGASMPLALPVRPGATSVGSQTITVMVANPGDANASDNTAGDLAQINPNPSEPPTSGVSVLAFPSRDFISSSGFKPADGPVTFQVWRNGLLVATSAPVPLVDDLTTPDFDGIAEVNHPGGGCWNTNTPDIRSGDQVRAITVSGVAHQTTVANVAVTGTARVGATNVFEVHGVAHNGAGVPLPLDQIEVRIRAGGGSTFATNGRNTLRAPLDGTLSYDAAGSANFTARFTVAASDVAAVTAAETRVHWLGRNPLSLAEATVFEFGTGILGGPSAPCTAPLAVSSDLTFGVTPVQVNGGTQVQFNIHNNGSATANNVRLLVFTDVPDRNGRRFQTIALGNLGNNGNTGGARIDFSSTFAATPVKVFVMILSDSGDADASNSVRYVQLPT